MLQGIALGDVDHVFCDLVHHGDDAVGVSLAVVCTPWIVPNRSVLGAVFEDLGAVGLQNVDFVTNVFDFLINN